MPISDIIFIVSMLLGIWIFMNGMLALIDYITIVIQNTIEEVDK